VSILAIVLIAAALIVVIGAEWPRLTRGLESRANERAQRERRRRKAELRVIYAEPVRDDFAESVQRDLDSLPVTKEPGDRLR
jgi:hypothetical protein